MSFLKKVKDILFEEEEYTEPVRITDDMKEEPKIVKIESLDEDEKAEDKKDNNLEEQPVKAERTFKFPDFDEEEFASTVSKPSYNSNVLEYEKKKTYEKRTDYGRYEKIETREYVEKKKFKPSPIISPVYGILNQDYKAEDIVNKGESASNINIDEVRKKAFEPVEKEKEVIDEPVVTFFEEKKETIIKPKDDYKSIDDLLEEASTELPLEDSVEIPKDNNLDAIEEELEKIDVKEKDEHDLDDTLDGDLFELIDSMYDDREEV